MRISIGQMNVDAGYPERNLPTVQSMTAEAKRRGSDLVIFPELWASGYDLEHAAQHADRVGEGLFATMSELAREHGLYLLAGSLLSREPQGFCNTSVLYGSDGKQLAVYSKLHLFRLMDEEKFLAAGNQRTVVDTPWGKAGMAICYDLRFPELFRRYALDGAKVFFLPAEWPHPRLAHWQTLLRARAIENQCFIVACNRVGKTGETEFFGHSTVIDPWGEIVVEAGSQEVLLTADIDLGLVDTIRRRIPIFADRREEVY
ncbi:MAG: carbon-nitrogen family hydrolase [Bacillota bacterium]